MDVKERKKEGKIVRKKRRQEGNIREGSARVGIGWETLLCRNDIVTRSFKTYTLHLVIVSNRTDTATQLKHV